MPNKTGKVLLIDDNDIDLKINSKVIKLSNFFDEIILCQSGEEGIKYITTNLENPALWPDFILLDIQMPEMGGIELTRTIRSDADELKANIPILGVTANVLEEDRKKYIESGINDLVLKPFSERDLINKISAYLS